MIHHNGLSIQILDDLAVHRVECRSLIITLEHYMELCFTQLSFEMEQTTNGRPRWICYTYWHCLPWCSFELECTTCADRSFQVVWWNIFKLRRQRRQFFHKFFLIETRNTRLSWKILTLLKCQRATSWPQWDEFHGMFFISCSSSILEISLQLRLISFLTSTSKFIQLELCFIQY